MSTKGKLLVVDDNEMNRDTLSRQLERAGYEVVTAAEGLEALSLIDGGNFDLILLDVMMPGLTGIELLKIVRNDHPASELPIIMATARDKSENMVEALSLGANDYVTKPLDLPVVLARIEAHLKMKNAAAKAAAAAPARAAAPVKTAIEPGAVLAGKFLLESKIGAGAFGAVYKAKNLALNNAVAVKVLQSSMMPTQEAVRRFRQEGISACRIQHPNAVSIVDFGVTDDGVAYLVMELLSGHPVSEEIKRQGTLTPRRAAEILLPLCDVLNEAHAAGIVHRDIKPANVFIHNGRAGEIVKVLDFGIAKLQGDADAEMTVEGTLVGTPAYMAPERLAGQPYDGRSDIYSVGILLYEMLCGQPPFKSPDLMAVAMMQMTQQPRPLRTLNPNVPPEIEAVVLEALVKDPELRMSASALAEKFTWAVKDSGTRPMKPAPLPAPTDPADLLSMETADSFPALPMPPPPPARPVGTPSSSTPGVRRPPRPAPSTPQTDEARDDGTRPWWRRLFGG